jgi:hypothetical protein
MISSDTAMDLKTDNQKNLWREEETAPEIGSETFKILINLEREFMSKFIGLFPYTYLVLSNGSQGWTEQRSNTKLNGRTAPVFNLPDTLTWRYNIESKFRSRYRKVTECPGIYLGPRVPKGYKYGDLALQVGGVSRIGTIKNGLCPAGLRPEWDCADKDQHQQ